MSAGVASSVTAFNAGCGSITAITTSHPGYEVPNIPTRPLLCGTCLIIQSTVSYVSVPSSIEVELPGPRGGRCMTNCPSDLNLPRMSWNAKINTSSINCCKEPGKPR